MKKISIIFIIAIFAYSGINAQDFNRKQTHSLGLNGGMSHAFGLSYQYWGEEFGLHTSLFPIASEKVSITAVSLAPMLKVYDGNRSRYYLYQSTGSYLYKNFGQQNEYEGLIMPAGGVGGKIWLTENLNFDFSFGIGVVFGVGDDFIDGWTMLPDVNLGFYYSF